MEPSTSVAAQPPTTSASIGDRISFGRFVTFLERLANAAKQPHKLRLLRQYYASFCEYQRTFCGAAKDVANVNERTFFPVLRLLVPSLDGERPACGIRTTTMGKLLVRILAVDKRSDVAMRLMRQYDEATGDGRGGGGDGLQHQRQQRRRQPDYADLVYEAMRQRTAAGGEKADVLTVATVNERLDRIARYYQENRRQCECGWGGWSLNNDSQILPV